MPHTKLFFLGSPRIERDGTTVEVDTRKAMALLAYLALVPQRHSRDALAALLWPEYNQSSARATLRRTLSSLGKALGGVGLDVDRDHIALDQASLWIDVDAFHERLAACRTHGHAPDETCAACVEPLTEAAALYRGDFLAGFTLRDSPTFDDWQFFQAESLRRELADALERLVREHSRAHNWEQAVGYARRWLALDPLNEAAHQALMRVHAWAGQRAAALRQYQKCAQLLEQELNVTPQVETTELYEEIKHNRLTPIDDQPVSIDSLSTDSKKRIEHRPTQAAYIDVSAAAPSPISHTAHPQPPLVGRAREWATLLDTYSTIEQDGKVIALEGEAGIGKTRLAEALLTHANARGAHTLMIRCYAGETSLAYGPFVEGLRTALRQPGVSDRLKSLPAQWIGEAARLLPELTDLWPDLPPPLLLDSTGAQRRLFEGVTEVLFAALENTTPPVLCFDDLHWTDASSLDLLIYLVRRLHGRQMGVLLTWRNENVGPAHRLRDLVGELERAGKATRLSLARLSQDDVQELAQTFTTAHSDLPTDFATRLHRETEGLPLFVVEYLTSNSQEQSTTPASEWTLPSGVRNLLRSRLNSVNTTGMQVLTTAAVIGRSFDLDTVRVVCERSEDEIIEALDDLLAHGLIAEVQSSALPAPMYDFSHDKLRTLVYDDTSAARKRLLHRRVAEALVAQAEDDPAPLAGQIAHHYQRAGQHQQAATYFKLAGEHARAVYANTEALAHFQRALALGHADTSEIHAAIGDLHTLGGEYAAAIASYQTAINLCQGQERAAIHHRLANVYQRRGAWELAEQHLEAALADLDTTESHSERARIYVDRSLVAHHQGKQQEAAERAHQALDLAETANDPRALAQAHNILGILASSTGEMQIAQRHLEQSLALAETLSDPSIRAAALNNLALVYASNGNIARALELFKTALSLCIAQGDRHREAALHNNIADLLHAAGRSTDAMGHLKQAVAIYAEIGVEAGTLQPAIWKLAEW